jgi:hypothetical protein
MAHVTDYGLALTEVAGALMALLFLRGLLLYARSLLRPAPAIAPVIPPVTFRRVSRPVAAPTNRDTPPATLPAAIEPTEILPPDTSRPLARSGSDLPLSSVILATNSIHTEEAADGTRRFYWSLVRFRHQRPENDA